LAAIDLNGESSLPNDAWDVAVLFQYSRTQAKDETGGSLERSKARHLAAVAGGLDGVRILDVTEPSAPVLLHQEAQQRVFRGGRVDVRSVAWNTQFDLGSQGGGIKSRERDYLFVHQHDGTDENRQQHVRAFDLSDPLRPVAAAGDPPRVFGGSGRLFVLRAYNAPFLQQFVLSTGAGDGAGTVLDASKMPTGLQPVGTWADPRGTIDLAIEDFAFDRLQDERGRMEKDISHEGSRYLSRDEMLKVLRTKLPTGPADRYGKPIEPKGERR
jgi:hypothetical protein